MQEQNKLPHNYRMMQMGPSLLSDLPTDREMWRGTIVRIKHWFTCTEGYYDYDFMLIDGNENIDDMCTFDVICINYKVGARSILSPMKCNIKGKQAVTAKYLFEQVLELINAVRGQDAAFTADEIRKHVFVYDMEDVKQICTEITPFQKGEGYGPEFDK